MPKEKAKELMQKYYETIIAGTEEKVQKFLVKLQSIIMVDEILKELISYKFNNDIKDNAPVEYWEQVKEEINKL